ncbi:MAG: hypothetical protein DDT31_00644 [Syntrophomonadaceae bacterium]|nr:hypothetical protein [Bacillota bacterium]
MKLQHTKHETKKAKKPQKQYRQLIDVVGAAIQGMKISRGYFMQSAVARSLQKKFPAKKVLQEVPLGSKQFKSEKHKVDIVVIDDIAQTVQLFSVKSEGISNTDPKQNVGLPQMADAFESAKIKWPEFTVTFEVLRTGGEQILEWEVAGFHTHSTSDYIGADIFELVVEEANAKFIGNIDRFIEEAKVTNLEQVNLLHLIAKTMIQPIIR